MALPTTQSISRFPLPDSLDTLPSDLRERILAVQEKAGFIPNVFLMLAHRPAEFRAFFAYHDALMEREADSLTQAEKEMIVVAVSADHGCLYCVVAHGAILRIRARNPRIADQVAINWRKAPLGARHKAMLEYAELVALDAESDGHGLGQRQRRRRDRRRRCRAVCRGSRE